MIGTIFAGLCLERCRKVEIWPCLFLVERNLYQEIGISRYIPKICNGQQIYKLNGMIVIDESLIFGCSIKTVAKCW